MGYYHRTTMSTGTTYKLNNGVEIPAVGFGTFASEGAKGESYKAVQVALKTGYRHLDCAWSYQNEGEVGEAIRDFLNAIAEKGGNSLAQVLIAWGLRRGYVVLPKSSTPSRIESNFKIPQLTDEDFNAVNEVAKGRHTRFVNMKDTFGYDVWPEEAGTAAAAASS